MKKVSGGTTTVYVFSGPQVIAEYLNGATPSSPTREYVYSGGALIATHEAGSLKFQMSDHLSHRVTTDTSGNILASSGHYPFGEQWYNTSAAKWLFTSYERDGESGNDYAIFRFHVNRLGRFGAPDPLAGSIGDPQSLNRYGYVLNDAVNAIDPLGLQRRKIEPVWNPDIGTRRYICIVDGMEMPCGLVSPEAHIRCPNNDCSGLIQQGGQLYRRVQVPVRRRSVDIKIEGTEAGGTDYYEWETQLRLVSTESSFFWSARESNAIKRTGNRPASTRLQKYFNEYVPCALGEGINQWWGDDEKAGITVAVHVAPLAPASLLKGGPWLYLGVAAAYDLNIAFRVRHKCTQEVYGGR